MAWTIILENEDNTIVDRVNSIFTISADNDLDAFRLFRYLDPYGDIFFNRVQMKDLIEDLKGLKKR